MGCNLSRHQVAKPYRNILDWPESTKARKCCCGEYCRNLRSPECCLHHPVDVNVYWSANEDRVCDLCKRRGVQRMSLPGGRVDKASERETKTAFNPDTDECPICLEPIRNPTFLSCGHCFCREHLNNLERCPLCRHSVNAASSNFPSCLAVNQHEQCSNSLLWTDLRRHNNHNNGNRVDLSSLTRSLDTTTSTTRENDHSANLRIDPSQERTTTQSFRGSSEGDQPVQEDLTNAIEPEERFRGRWNHYCSRKIENNNLLRPLPRRPQEQVEPQCEESTNANPVATDTTGTPTFAEEEKFRGRWNHYSS